MANVTIHTAPTSIRSYQSVAAGASYQDTLDLRTAIKAIIFCIAARQNTSNLGGNPLAFVVRPTYGDLAERSPSDAYGRVGTTTTAANSTTSSTAVTAGTTKAITVGSATGIVADQLVGIEVGTSNFEVARVSNVSGTTITFDAPLTKSHSGTYTVTTLAESWAIEVPGGAKYEIITDFGAGTGTAYDVRVVAQVHDYDVIT